MCVYIYYKLLLNIRIYHDKYEYNIITLDIPSNEGSLIRARHRSLQRAAHSPLFPH